MADKKEVIKKSYFRLVGFMTLVAIVLFASYGSLDWIIAWVFLVIYSIVLVLGLIYVDPGLLEERSRIGPGAKKWDIFLASFVVLFLFPVTFLISGLDAGRYHWSPRFPVWIQIAGLIVFIIGCAIQSWAIITNKFFSTVVRIQTERGHYVVTDGPYRYVRHPGYTGAIVVSLSLPLIFGSLWAFVPALIGDILLVIRTVLEDNTLKNELKGYAGYTTRVRSRLIPGVW